jgi:Domain of unknown function (DUF4375)
MLAAWADPFEEIDAVYQAIGRDLFGRDDLRHALSARADPDEAAFFTLVLVGSEIDDGGFAQLFTNSAGDVFTDAIAGADRFGLRITFALLRETGGEFFSLSRACAHISGDEAIVREPTRVGSSAVCSGRHRRQLAGIRSPGSGRPNAANLKTAAPSGAAGDR